MPATASPSASISESVGRQGAGSAHVRRWTEDLGVEVATFDLVGLEEAARTLAAEKPRASIATAIRPAWRNVWMSSPKVSAVI